MALLLSSGSTRATSHLPVADSFSYAVGNLGQVGSGSSWSGSTSANKVTTNNLDGTGLGLVASSGGMVAMTSSSGQTYNTFASASGDITNGTVYCSFLLKVTDATSVSTSGESPINLSVQSSSSPHYAELWAKNVSGSVQLGLAKNGGTVSYITSGAGSSVADGSTYLVVISHQFVSAGSTDDVVKLWVNPATLNTANEDANPKVTTSSGSDVTGSAGIGRFYFTGGVACNVDELRIGTSWKDVTPSTNTPAPPLTAPRITRAFFSPQGFTLHGSNGPASSIFGVLASSDLTLPLNQWSLVDSGQFASDGHFDWTNSILPGVSQQFFLLQVGASAPSAPVIRGQPQSQEASLGQSITLNVTALGALPLSYQWYFNTNTSPGATNAALSIPSVSSNDFGTYFVVVSNTFGAVTSSVAMLSLLTVPTNGDFYVSPSGNDSNPGTLNSPFFSVSKAMSLAAPGNTIYMRGGTYYYTQTINVQTSGAPGNRIKLWAVPGEHPLLDFTNQPYGDSYRAFYLTTNANWWHVKGLEVARAGDNGMKIEGSHNLIELCVFHDNGDTGLQIGFSHQFVNDGTIGASNEVVNCDSYHNYDQATRGGNADGFACKLHPGAGNVFRGCRAWFNSDDAWDFFESDSTIVLSNCWAWHSGDKNLFPASSSFGGNGNGFKMGGDGAGGSSKGTHLAMNCVAFNCHFPNTSANGFTDNSHADGEILYNCTSFGNNYNFFFEQTVNSGKTNIFKNDVSFGNTGSNAGISFGSGAVIQQNDSWTLPVTANSADFMDLTEALAASPRQADGSLPLGFARLVSGSDLIDQGVNVGLPFNGPAPDLGAYEYSP